MTNSFSFLAKSARQWPDNIALQHGNLRYNYREFHDRALAVGGNLRKLGCETGDRVAFCLPNSPHIMEIIFGCFAAGLIVVPINARLHAKEIAYIVQNSGAKILVHGDEYQDGITKNIGDFSELTYRICTQDAEGALHYDALLSPENALPKCEEVAAEDPCWLFYTSGTTGKPKGAIWNHRMVRVVIMNYLADVYNIQPGENLLHVAPMSHGSGIVALPAVARGANNAIFTNASFEPDQMFAEVQELGVSHIAFMAPTQIIKMLEDYEEGKYDLSCLKAICYGGAPFYVEHLRNAVKTFGSIFAQIYGQGEAPITITGLDRDAHSRLLATNDPRIGSTGQARTDVETFCVDADDNILPAGEAGEVVARGDIVMPGYWGNEEASAETLRNGWLHTGDIGYFDDRGYLFLLDRAKDMIISGGNNVYPREVEEVIIQHEDVADVVVLGIPHEYWGEAVHAVVVREQGKNISAQQIIDYCGEHMAGYKKPKDVDFVDALPVSGYGKVLRREVRERYWQGQDAKIGGGQSSAQKGTTA